nr:gustatory receptor 24 [Podabrus annulatus]
MSARKEVLISEAIRTSSSPSIYVGRFFGIFPFVIQKNGPHIFLKWSLKFAIYSLIVGFILVTFTIKGMVDDLNAGSTKSIRMKHETAKYVTIVDISIVILIVFVGIFGLYLRVPGLFSFIDCINEIDSMLVISDAKKARKTSLYRLCVVLITIGFILITDLTVWWTIADNSIETTEFLISNYIPFYLCYYVVFMLEFQYWHLVYSVKRRLKLMNDCLKLEFITPYEILQNVKDKAFAVFKQAISSNRNSFAISAQSMENIVGVLEKQKKISDLFFIRNAKRLREFTVDECIVKIIKIYLLLCDAADFINNCCGLPILMILISCLLHLVVTPYFMVVEITGRKNLLFLTLQSIWLLTHIVRLVIIVEGCYGCTVELKKTRPLVCKLFSYDFDEKFKRQLHIFAAELNYRVIEYTACGLFTIDRTLITTIAGAVTTYLVILIQFQKTNDDAKHK